MISLKILLIFTFVFIFFQDYKERLVYWFLYPLVGIFGFLIQLNYTNNVMALVNISVNLILVLTVLLVLWVYSKLILKQKLINQGIGIGDILFFVALCCCFSIISFFVFFTFSLLFALALHLVSKLRKTPDKTIPLAGYMSVFFAFVYGASIFVKCNFIFAY